MEGFVRDSIGWRSGLNFSYPGGKDEFRKLMDELDAVGSLARRHREIVCHCDVKWEADDTFTESLREAYAAARKVEAVTGVFEWLWRSQPKKTALRLMEHVPGYWYYLARTWKFDPSIYPERSGEIGGGSIPPAYLKTMSGRSYKLANPSQGKEDSLEKLEACLRSEDETVRRSAWDEILRVWTRPGPALGRVYAETALNWINAITGLKDCYGPMSVRNLVYDLERRLMMAIIEAVSRGSSITFSEYFRRKKVLMNKDRLELHDIFAPVNGGMAPLSFREALCETEAAFGEFSPSLTGLASRVLDRGSLSAVWPGRNQCRPMSPGESPLVLMNWQGGAEDALELARLLFHAAHLQLSSGVGDSQFVPGPILAECGRAFGEELLTRRLIAREKDPSRRVAIVCLALDRAWNDIGRGLALARLEIAAHGLDCVDAVDSPEKLGEEYLYTASELIGDSMLLPRDFRWEWTRELSIFRPPYFAWERVMGKVAALSLWRSADGAEENWVERIVDIFRRGGSAPPTYIFDKCGMSLDDEDFWNRGIESLFELVETL
jgi:oligoendopeptidase F